MVITSMRIIKRTTAIRGGITIIAMVSAMKITRVMRRKGMVMDQATAVTMTITG